MSSGEYTRSRDTAKRVTSGGPYEAVVVSHLDRKYMGGLEVEILRYTGSGGNPERSGQLLTVRYLSPFYGVTPNRGLQSNDGYKNTQQSYGMWMVPPDVGTRVLVIFAEGNPNFGYWIGCIQDDYMNFMVPDGRASTQNTTSGTPDNLKGAKLPVGEYNKKLADGTTPDPTLYEKPFNKDFTEVLEVQGLLFDEIRGTTTTSARREVPSSVFGVSTPGPVDKRKGTSRYAAGPRGNKVNKPFSRLGGSSIVMDDGDEKFIRATHPQEGPPIYLNRTRGETGGDETIPQNELTRIRTRTGHQILLHNSEDLIYIGNSRGTAWIELTSDGKIDIHAQDSISVMSDNDINFTASRDFNIDAGRNVNIKASARWSDGLKTVGDRESGRIHLESEHDTNIHVGDSYSKTVGDIININSGSDAFLTTGGDYNLYSKANIYQKSEATTNIRSVGNTFVTSQSEMHTVVDADAYLRVGNSFESTIGGDSRSSISGELNLDSNAGINIITSGDFKNRSGGNYQVYSDGDVGITATGSGDIKMGENYRVSAADDISHQSTNMFADAESSINQTAGSMIARDAPGIEDNSSMSTNGTAAGEVSPTSFTPASIAAKSDTPLSAQLVKKLTTVSLPYVFPGADRPVPYDSILTRAPQHEPWGHHENMNPVAFRKAQTDREVPGMLPVNDRVLTPDTFAKGTSSNVSSRYVLGSQMSGAFTGTTGDGVIGQGETTNTFAPTSDEGKLVQIRTRSGLTALVAEVFQKNFQDFVNDLEATGYKIKRIAGYSKRKVTGNSGSWSIHASGAAIDINWPTPAVGGYPNGYFSPRPVEAPMTDMPSNTFEIAQRHGLGWGGAWRTIDDAMHFSAHIAEGGAYDFPRNGLIPIGPSNTEDRPIQKDGESVAPPSNINPENESTGLDEAPRSDANIEPEE